jgi:hypothetical protein
MSKQNKAVRLDEKLWKDVLYNLDECGELHAEIERQLQGEEDAGGSMLDRAQEITDQVVGKMIDKEMMRMHPSSPWDRETIIAFIHHAALQGLAESRSIAEGLQSPSAIADMMTALVGTLDQMGDVRGLPAAHERQIRRREMEDEVLRLSRKVN